MSGGRECKMVGSPRNTGQVVKVWVCVVLLLALVVSCSPPAPPAMPTEVPATPTKAPEEKTLVISVADIPPSMDSGHNVGATMAEVTQNLYWAWAIPEVLSEPGKIPVANTSAGEAGMGPGAFESWEVSEDGKVWTMHLGRNIVDSFGNQMKAEDAKWLFERTIALPSASWVAANLGLTSSEQIKVLDDYTLQFTLEEPNPIFLRSLFPPANTPLGAATARQHTTAQDPWAEEWLRRNAPATGPWMVETWTPGEELILVRNPNFFGKPAPIDRVVYRYVPEAATRLALLIAGEVDIAYDLDRLQLETADKAEGTYLVCLAGNYFDYMAFNTTEGPTANRKVRQALAYAVPYEDILSSVYGGEAAPLWSFVTGNVPNVVPRSANPYKYDLQKAKALLTEAGFPDGFDLEVLVSDKVPEHERIAVLLKDRFAEIGVNLLIDMKPQAAFIDLATQRQLESVIGQDYSIVLDVTYQANLWLRNAPPPNDNFSGYASPEFNLLQKETVLMPEGPERGAKQVRMQEIVIEDSPWFFLANPPTCYAMRERVIGYTWHTTNKLLLSDLDIVD